MRHNTQVLRRIIDKRYLGDVEHWIRFRDVADVGNDYNFNLDYIELVPLHIVSDPLKPEDRH